MSVRKKKRQGWDAVRQLIRYKEVVGVNKPISAETIRSGELFRDDVPPTE